MKVEERLKELGVELPEPAKPLASYIPYARTGNLIYISGQLCTVEGELKYKGKVGEDVSEEEAYDCLLYTSREGGRIFSGEKRLIAVNGEPGGRIENEPYPGQLCFAGDN